MGTDYEKAAYTEIVNRPDKGAGVAILFQFAISGQEMVDLLNNHKLQQNPSLAAAEANAPAGFADGMLVRTAELKGGQPIGNKVTPEEITAAGVNSMQHAVKKDLYAMFATAGYLVTKFDRVMGVTVTDESGNRKFMEELFNTSHFNNGKGTEGNTKGFFIATITKAGERAGFKEMNAYTMSRKFHFTISALPKF